MNDTTDGSTRLVDGAYIVQVLKQQFPTTYQFFRDVPLIFTHIEQGVVAKTKAPVIKVDSETEELIQFRFNSYDLAPISYLSSSQIDEYYIHTSILLDTILNPNHIKLVKLGVGDMIVVDNHRVMHGRTAFTGYRNLIGCYVGRDDWELRARWIFGNYYSRDSR
jgi:trimethyllysine dioxygenase